MLNRPLFRRSEPMEREPEPNVIGDLQRRADDERYRKRNALHESATDCWGRRPAGQADEVRDSRSDSSLLRAYDCHHIGLARWNVHLGQRLPYEKQRRGHRERRNDRRRGEEQARWDMREDHRVHQSYPAREPGRRQGGQGVQYWGREEEDNHRFNWRPESLEEEVRHERR